MKKWAMSELLICLVQWVCDWSWQYALTWSLSTGGYFNVEAVASGSW